MIATPNPIKQQYYFTRPGSGIVLMAGIYENGQFTIMTTDPNDTMEPIHDRMPVVLLPEELETWLHGDYESLLQPHGRDNIKLIAEKEAA